jgi:hypothetical protein
MKAITHENIDLETETPFPHDLMQGAGTPSQDLNVNAAAPAEADLPGEGQEISLSSRCAEHSRVWTPARREAVESYIKYLQGVLRLQDWTITIDWSKPTKKDSLATMAQMPDSKHATLRLSPEFVTQAPQLHGQILLHEMVHGHLFQLESLACSAASALGDKRVAAVFNVAYTASNEVATDALADAFHPLVEPFRLP